MLPLYGVIPLWANIVHVSHWGVDRSLSIKKLSRQISVKIICSREKLDGPVQQRILPYKKISACKANILGLLNETLNVEMHVTSIYYMYIGVCQWIQDFQYGQKFHLRK